jgi:hypothetical protein
MGRRSGSQTLKAFLPFFVQLNDIDGDRVREALFLATVSFYFANEILS